ncbi:cytochrome b N-terminal domain-containing protein [Nocardioides sp. YIM 152315]|nr:cytochrome b N-terminal domain-containing protein [Nocardioides sp. YIM 152315]
MNFRPATRTVPLHWTMLLGVISLSCLFVLTVTGAVLLFFFEPSSETVRYEGSYPLLQGVPVSRAYASTLHVSLEVPGGLLVRQAHHWAALVLPAALTVQMLSTFFTSGFRRPREWSWVLLATTFLLALAGGWSGYGLADDQLAGTGLRIAEGILVGVPLIGTRASFLLLGGEFPGQVIERMYWLHVAIIPAVLALVLLLRLRLALGRKPAQFPGSGRTEHNVVGLPLAAVAVRAFGLFLITTGVLVFLAGVITINPVWKYGPSTPGAASAGSQPDWYTGFLDGSLRLAPPGWEVTVLGGTFPLGVLLPQAVAGGLLVVVVLWPFLETRATGDRWEHHHVLDRPREHPTRTAFGVSGLVVFVTLWTSGATDLIATQLHLSFEHQVLALRTLLVLGPLVAFPLTRELCRALVAREQEEVQHGVETGRIMRAADGGYSEVHEPLDLDRSAVLEHVRIERQSRWPHAHSQSDQPEKQHMTGPLKASPDRQAAAHGDVA